MSSSLGRLLALTGVLAAILPATAQAQLYTWRDAAGHLVISKTPKTGADATFAVVNVDSPIRTTRPTLGRRAARFEPLIVQEASAHGVRPDLVRAVIQAESAFDPFARSHKGAMGLMQLMPATAEEVGVTDPYDPEQNVRGGVKYLKGLLAKYAGNEELALAAYNAGPGAVQKYGDVPPYRETREYIRRIQANASVQPAAATVIRKVEIIDGREVTRFVTVPAAPSGAAAPPRHSNHR